MHKNYKQSLPRKIMQGDGKRGQVAIFVVVAIVIVAVILVFFLVPRGNLPGSGTSQSTNDPEKFLQTCMGEAVREEIAVLGGSGGYDPPQGFVVHQGDKIPYLCYTSEYYKPCIVQQPNIQRQFEKVLEENLKRDAESCISSFKEDAEGRGFDVSQGKSEVNVSFVPGSIRVQVISPLTVNNEISRTYRSFDLGYNSELYELLAISTSVVDFESSLGDSEITLYTQYYPDIKIEKMKLSDGTTIYEVSNVLTDEKFRFASRSLAWPPGFAAT